MKHLLSILCLFVLSCDSDGDGVCSYENACNYGENAECYYFFPADSVDDGYEYHCGDMQVLQDIIDISTFNFVETFLFYKSIIICTLSYG